MRRIVLTAALPLAALATPAFGQEEAQLPPETETLEHLSDSLSDPVRQQQLADTLAVLTEVLLDLPLAPLVEPLAEATADIAGEKPRPVDPDMTLRRMAPGAGRLSGEIQDKLPRAMDAMARLSESFSVMLPALREMGERMKDALPRETR